MCASYCHWHFAMGVFFMCLWVLVWDCFIVSAEAGGWTLQCAAFTLLERRKHGEVALKVLFRCCEDVWYIWVSVKRHQMWSDRPLSAACSVLWQRKREIEWVKIHPALGRRSLWQRLLWWWQCCTWSDDCDGTPGISPSRTAGGEMHTNLNEERGKETTWGEIQEDDTELALLESNYRELTAVQIY